MGWESPLIETSCTCTYTIIVTPTNTTDPPPERVQTLSNYRKQHSPTKMEPNSIVATCSPLLKGNLLTSPPRSNQLTQRGRKKRRRPSSRKRQRQRATSAYYGNDQGIPRQGSPPHPPHHQYLAALEVEWPPEFLNNGAFYIFDSKSRMFYEATSRFFYEPNSKLYYCAKKKAYFRYDSSNPTAPFQKVVEAVDSSDEQKSFEGTTTSVMNTSISSSSSTSTPTGSSDAQKSFEGTATSVTNTSKRSGSSSGYGSGENLKNAESESKTGTHRFDFKIKQMDPASQEPHEARTLEILGAECMMSAVLMSSSTTPCTTRKRKHLTTAQKQDKANILKGNKMERKMKISLNAEDQEKRGGQEQCREKNDRTTAITSSYVSSSTSDCCRTDNGMPICALCRRKFQSLYLLQRHEKLSELHKSNLAKMAPQSSRGI